MTEDETFLPLPDDLEPTRLDGIEVAFGSGDRIGPYRVLQKLDEGGMGVVYEAEQEEPVRRRVAVKVIKLGMDTEQVVRRFEGERQALALMDHPHIARVFDAGATDQGRPYFAMEFVRGAPITSYCDRVGLDTRGRLKLFILVCDAVQHAHQKGIIHRDLKPSNVLVRDQDGKHVPKIIDFGIAKATDHRLTDKTLFTVVGQLVGTPEYMSPEQAEMGGLDVDTRADVYMLGVLLYELLTHELPFPANQLQEVGIEQYLRKIRDEEPPRPSTRVTSSSRRKTDSPDEAGRTTGAPARLLKGDLDWITMKALEKDRTRRYQTASELAADVERYLGNEPVMAGPPGNVYRLKKFVRRHRASVTFAAVLLALLAGFATTMTVQRTQIARARDQARIERDRAAQEAATAREVSEFLESLFRVSDPSETLGNTITAREMLDRGAERIEAELVDQPRVAARLMHTMGQVYASLGLFQDARSFLEKSLWLRQARLGAEHEEVADGMQSLAELLAGRFGDYDEARRLLEKALVIRRARHGPQHELVAANMNTLAIVLDAVGEYDGALAMFEQAGAIWEQTLGVDDPKAVASLANRAALLMRSGDYDAALPLYQRTLDVRREALGGEHPQVARSLALLGDLLEARGELDAAAIHQQEALRIREKVFGATHPRVAESLVALARVRYRQRRTGEADALHARARTIHEATGGFDKPYPLVLEAGLHAVAGRMEQALSHLRRAVDRGFTNVAQLLADPSFNGVHGDPRFEGIVAEMKRRNRQR